MNRRGISTGSTFEAAYGYSHAVIEDGWVFVAGTTGFDYATGEIEPDAESQTLQTLKTIESVLAEAGATLADIVQSRIIIADQSDAERVLTVYGQVIGAAVGDGVRPTSTAIVARLIDDRMKVEIEVTARRPAGQKAG